jgi:Homeodomain-like domain
MLDISVPPHGVQVLVIRLACHSSFAASDGGRPGLALVEVSVVAQRYRAVLDLRAGAPVTEVAARAGVSRQSVHAWVRPRLQTGAPRRIAVRAA